MSYGIHLFYIIMFCVAFKFKGAHTLLLSNFYSSCCICYILHVTSMCNSNKQWYLVFIFFNISFEHNVVVFFLFFCFCFFVLYCTKK